MKKVIKEDSYETIWDLFWKDIIIDKSGNINLDQVKRELYDYSNLMTEASKVYDSVTFGRASKANSSSSAIISLHDDYINENYIRKDDAKELIDNLKEELGL